MSVKSTCRLDPQGRIVLPVHFRKALSIGPGNVVSVDMDDDGAIRVRATHERCSVCGNNIDGKHHTDVNINKSKKHICFECAQAIARAMMK